MRLYFLALLLVLSTFSTAFSQAPKTVSWLPQILNLPAPPPPNTELDETAKRKERAPEFLSYKNIPPDDAPIEDLIDYWSAQTGDPNRFNFRPEISSKSVERLLDYCEEHPEDLSKFLTSFPAKPEVAEVVKKIYDKKMQNQESEVYEYEQIKEWLKHNSKYYVNDLVSAAQKIKDTNEYISNEDEYLLRDLAKVDWDSASPIVSRLESDSSQPYSQILAKWVLYKHALEVKDSGDTDRYRRQLQDIVENRDEFWKKRDLAMDALVSGGDWDGRDEWYLSLLSDETLLKIQDNNYTGLTTMISATPPDKWLEKMIELTKSSNFAARSAAVRNLINSFAGEKDIAEALLPWLTDANWAKSSGYAERRKFITALGEMDLPASVPGLISVLTNEEEFQTIAAKSLVKYKDSRAVSALQTALAKSKDAESRNIFIEALIACGGYSDDEQMLSLEAFAIFTLTPEGLEKVQNPYEYNEGGEAVARTLPLRVSIGKFVADQIEPSEGLALRAIERLKVLRRTKPIVAKRLAEIMEKWQGRAIYLEMLRQIKTGEANTNLILNVLAKRKDLREKVPNEVTAMQAESGATRGIGACLAENEQSYAEILAQTDKDAQIATFGCARMIRAKLPVAEAGNFLKSPDKLLALAAERYLESEDSISARKLVLTNRPGEALILGARTAFFTDGKASYDQTTLSALFETINGYGFWSGDLVIFKKAEQNLQKEIKTDANLLAVYALLPAMESGQQIIRVYKDRIVYTFYEDAARFHERNLTAQEYEDFYRFLLDNNIDGLSKLGSACDECMSSEFVMFGKGGGRRVFIESVEDAPKAIGKLFELFEDYKKGELKLNYALSSKIKGLEVLLADDKFPVYAVWKKDGDLRFLVEDKAQGEEIEKSIAEQFRLETLAAAGDESGQAQRYEAMAKRRSDMQFAHYGWRNLENGKLGGIVSQPSNAQFLIDETQVRESPTIDAAPRAWQVRAGSSEIRTGSYYEGGLYKIAPGQNPSKFKEGNYANPIVTADGKWVIATKAAVNWNEPSSIVRINLQTNKEFPVNILPADSFYPVAFIAAQNKVLLYRAKGGSSRYRTLTEDSAPDEEGDTEIDVAPVVTSNKPNPSPLTPETYLLDANTGVAQLVKGEFQPLQQQTYRPLQPTGNANEFWAAIYRGKTKVTEIGRYNEKTFTFQPLKQIPDINLNSMDVWVDEKEAKIYFVYQGHLLTLPLADN